jgi:hypothetical protein
MKILSSSIIITLLVLFAFCAESYAERICLAPAGCKVEMDTGFCEMCVDKEVITTTTPVIKVSFNRQKNTGSMDTPTSYYQRGYPTQPEQNLLTSSIHHFSYNKLIGKSLPKKREPITEMVKIVPFSKKKLPFFIKRSRTRVALCRSGCPSSRASTMGYMHDGFYWLKKPSVWETRNRK